MLALIESLTDFCIVFGVIPCSLLYCSWIFLLLFVSDIAFSIDSVSSSAYIITLPSVFLAARPIVCINERSERKKPSLSASSIATNDTSGISNPSLKRLIPTSTSNSPSLNERIISILSKALISECIYLTLISNPAKYAVKSSAIFLVRVVTKTLSFFWTLSLISSIKSSIWFSTGLTSIFGSNNPVGLIICSTTFPLECSNSYSAGVALTNTTWFILCSNSLNFKGLLSKADGSLKPYFTNDSFLALSPLYIALTCGMVACDSSINSKKSFGK